MSLLAARFPQDQVAKGFSLYMLISSASVIFGPSLGSLITAAVVYLADDESAYTTGQILSVSGGFGLAAPFYGDLFHPTLRR